MPALAADKRALKQILINLLTNSVKYSRSGGRVDLSAEYTGNIFALTIRDTGVGISAEKIPTLTDPFVRTETDPLVAQEGKGLGLAIVKSLVDLHGGLLDIKSQVGVGTTVTVTLPASRD